MAPSTEPNTWTSVTLTEIGHNDLETPGNYSFEIPSIIPSTASNVLVYLGIRFGGAITGVSQNFKIFTQDETRHYEKYLYMLGYYQAAINTNSENMWFPMPADRMVHLTVYRSIGQSCQACIHVIGYN